MNSELSVFGVKAEVAILRGPSDFLGISLDPSGNNQSQSMAHLSLSTQGQTIDEAICLQRIYGILTLDHLTGGTF